MAFAIKALMQEYEFRGLNTATSKKGKVFKTLRVESEDGRTAEVSCSDETLFSSCDALVKGSKYDFPVIVVSTAPHGDVPSRSYIVLESAPLTALGY